jgi:hypothetical protein
MEYCSLLQRGPNGPMQPILKEQFAPPLDHVGEQIAVEGGVLGQQRVQVELALGGDELVEPDLPRRDLGPGAGSAAMVRVRSPLTDAFKDHLVRLSAHASARPHLCTLR